MNKSVKKVVSAVCAVVMAMSMTVTAMAADYASPVFPNAPSAPAAATTVSTNEVKKVENGGTVEVSVNPAARLVIKPTTLKALAAKEDATLKLVSNKATIEIDSDSISKVGKIDLSMKISNTASRTRIKMKSDKEFGVEVKITITTCELSAEKLAKAHVYCDGEDLGPVELDESGNPVITVTKGGVYEIK